MYYYNEFEKDLETFNKFTGGEGSIGVKGTT